MQPKDWSRIEKLLENTADKETLDAVKEAVETMETSLTGKLTANVVKSIQRGVITIADRNTTATATINAVNRNKSYVIPTGSAFKTGNWDPIVNLMGRLELTSETVVTAIRDYTDTSRATTVVYGYTVIEYY